jgi:hypothetical protein
MRLYAKQFAAPVELTDQVFALEAQTRYVLETDTASSLPEVDGVLTPEQGAPWRAALCFRNYVGVAELAGHRFRVVHKRLSEPTFEAMLQEVVQRVADLVFDYGSPTLGSYERRATPLAKIAYHTLAYLRLIMGYGRSGSRGADILRGQFAEIARAPHERIRVERAWVPPQRVSCVDAHTISAVVTHPEVLAVLPTGSALATSPLAQKLTCSAGALFPREVSSTQYARTYDNHENRLVKHFLEAALRLVSHFAARPTINAGLREELDRMRAELSIMLRTSFLAEVGPMTLLPLGSTVLQRRDGYRHVLRHYLQLQLASQYAWSDLWQRLLEFKDAARLYEIWTFFKVKGIVDELCGLPEHVEFTRVDDDDTSTRRVLRHGLQVDYSGGHVQLRYNNCYSPATGGSYSLRLFPDIVLRVADGDDVRSLVLDAKLSFDGAAVVEVIDPDGDPDDDEEHEPPERWAARRDLYKMHAYRDAMSGEGEKVKSAYVLFPGTQLELFPKGSTLAQAKLGSIPLCPGNGANPALTELLRAFLSE